MLRILSATARNFLTMGNITQTIDLAIDGLTLVLGENLDIGGTNSRNGVGKTGIVQAICYGLFGKPLTKIRLDNLCNNINNKDMLVTIDFEVNGKTYRIERGRKPNLLRFFVDGVHRKDDTAEGENKHTQAEIERIIGMSSMMFRHIVALNTSTVPFMREESGVQREVIEELFGITQLSQRAETLKKLMDVTKEHLRDEEASVKANGDANARIQQAVDRALGEAENWQTAQDHHVARLAAQAEILLAIDIETELAVFDRLDQWQHQQEELIGKRQDTERQITTLSQEIARLGKDVARYEADAQATDTGEVVRLQRQAQLFRAEASKDIQPQIERLRAETVRRQQESSSKFTEARDARTELAEVVDQLDHPDRHTCATCGQGLKGTDHLAKVLTNLTRQQVNLTAKIELLTAASDRANAEAKAVEDEIDRLRVSDQEECAALLAKIASLDAEIIRTETSIAERRAVVTQQAADLRITMDHLVTQRQHSIEHLAALTDLEPAPTSTYRDRDAVWHLRQERDRLGHQLATEVAAVNPHQTKVDGLRSTLLTIDYSTLNDLNIRYKHEQFLHKLLTAKDSFIRKKILDQNITYLNRRLNYYLEKLGLPHEVAFITDLTTEISLLGRGFDFEQLSRGEMNRAILATSWSFRDVWENLNQALNLLFVDEMLDQGTDGAGVEAALDILTDVANDRHKSVFLISHREELRDRIDRVTIVRKEHQFTSIA